MTTRADARAIAAVGIGGAAGTLLRLAADALVPATPGGPPWSTLAINVLGCVLLGVLVARMPDHAPEWLRAGLGAGVLGSFTTFSAVAVAAVELGTRGSAGVAVLYVAVTVAAGLGAAAAGLALGGSGSAGHPAREIGTDE